ncbi:hypothetical protein X798_05990 [Onchocerca flexuosa]|uniref:Uncharacterized protein n=1 Tax=Onchocerca flexuosa TaxID=387005 RepID=A0A238BPW4_9BILA|nr:hypothetical protein X798_05990 [Onchocerca flexuosa]
MGRTLQWIDHYNSKYSQSTDNLAVNSRFWSTFTIKFVKQKIIGIAENKTSNTNRRILSEIHQEWAY